MCRSRECLAGTNLACCSAVPPPPSPNVVIAGIWGGGSDKCPLPLPSDNQQTLGLQKLVCKKSGAGTTNVVIAGCVFVGLDYITVRLWPEAFGVAHGLGLGLGLG